LEVGSTFFETPEAKGGDLAALLFFPFG